MTSANMSQTRWTCDICKIKSFSTYEDAVAHERHCVGTEAIAAPAPPAPPPAAATATAATSATSAAANPTLQLHESQLRVPQMQQSQENLYLQQQRLLQQQLLQQQHRSLNYNLYDRNNGITTASAPNPNAAAPFQSMDSFRMAPAVPQMNGMVPTFSRNHSQPVPAYDIYGNPSEMNVMTSVPSVGMNWHPNSQVTNVNAPGSIYERVPARTSTVWTCDVCRVADFPTFELATQHEKTCQGISPATRMTNFPCRKCARAFATVKEVELHEIVCPGRKLDQPASKGSNSSQGRATKVVHTIDLCDDDDDDDNEEKEEQKDKGMKNTEAGSSVINNHSDAPQDRLGDFLFRSKPVASPVQIVMKHNEIPNRPDCINIIPFTKSFRRKGYNASQVKPSLVLICSSVDLMVRYDNIIYFACDYCKMALCSRVNDDPCSIPNIMIMPELALEHFPKCSNPRGPKFASKLFHFSHKESLWENVLSDFLEFMKMHQCPQGFKISDSILWNNTFGIKNNVSTALELYGNLKKSILPSDPTREIVQSAPIIFSNIVPLIRFLKPFYVAALSKISFVTLQVRSLDRDQKYQRVVCLNCDYCRKQNRLSSSLDHDIQNFIQSHVLEECTVIPIDKIRFLKERENEVYPDAEYPLSLNYICSFVEYFYKFAKISHKGKTLITIPEKGKALVTRSPMYSKRHETAVQDRNETVVQERHETVVQARHETVVQDDANSQEMEDKNPGIKNTITSDVVMDDPVRFSHGDMKRNQHEATSHQQSDSIQQSKTHMKKKAKDDEYIRKYVRDDGKVINLVPFGGVPFLNSFTKKKAGNLSESWKKILSHLELNDEEDCDFNVRPLSIRCQLCSSSEKFYKLTLESVNDIPRAIFEAAEHIKACPCAPSTVASLDLNSVLKSNTDVNTIREICLFLKNLLGMCNKVKNDAKFVVWGKSQFELRDGYDTENLTFHQVD